jgi:HD-like signal output (HDOD) protein
MSRPDLKNIVDRIVDLPTLPQVVTTIMTLLEDPQSSAKDINDVMRNDPALAAKILKLVNSAFYGLPNSVSSIQQAIAILGFNTIKSLAISASVFDLFGDGEGDFSYEDFWAHSVGTATVSNFLAKREPGVNPDTAFVIGLLHGMGKLVLDQYTPSEFQKIIATAKENQLSFAQAEEELLDTSFSELGYWLGNKWKLAVTVQEALRFQGNLAECPERSRVYAAILNFSSYICRLKKYGANGDFNKPSLPRDAWDCLHIDRDELPEMIEKINIELENANSFLQVIQS